MAATPPTAAPMTGPTCPACHAPVPSTAKFCPSCGATLSPSAVAPTPGTSPPATGPVDLRESVDQSRGTLKRLELLIPGYHGYRQADDIRAADSLLRRQVADRLKNARTTAENARTALTTSGQFTALNDLAPLVADLFRLEPKVRSAEQGYSGIAAALKVGPQQLDRLYQVRLRIRHRRRPVRPDDGTASRPRFERDCFFPPSADRHGAISAEPVRPSLPGAATRGPRDPGPVGSTERW